MSMLSQFTPWYQNLLTAVTDALSGPVQDGLKQKIRERAQKNVYDAYDGGGYRRGQIGAAQNLEAEVLFHQLRITNVTPPQGGAARATETSFVEGGYANYNQPFPRPFMDEALEEYTGSGQAQEDLAAALRSKGFTVV